MAAPDSTERGSPGGKPIETGYQFLIAFALDSDVEFWEKSVQPPSLDGGDMINISTQHNTEYRTFVTRSLVTVGNVALVVSYDPLCYTSIRSLINTNGSITIHFPDGSTLDFYGSLLTFEPQPCSEDGGQPEANITIGVTNWDSTNDLEVGPVMTEVSGT